jgi:thiamine biosynthesis protein ThiS
VSNSVRIFLQGEAREVPDGQTVLGLLDSLGLNSGRVAVELDGLILKKSEWPRCSLQPGTRLEVVHFVGGG